MLREVGEQSTVPPTQAMPPLGMDCLPPTGVHSELKTDLCTLTCSMRRLGCIHYSTIVRLVLCIYGCSIWLFSISIRCLGFDATENLRREGCHVVRAAWEAHAGPDLGLDLATQKEQMMIRDARHLVSGAITGHDISLRNTSLIECMLGQLSSYCIWLVLSID